MAHGAGLHAHTVGILQGYTALGAMAPSYRFPCTVDLTDANGTLEHNWTPKSLSSQAAQAAAHCPTSLRATVSNSSKACPVKSQDGQT